MEEAQPIALSKKHKSMSTACVHNIIQQNCTITALELLMKHVICTYISRS